MNKGLDWSQIDDVMLDMDGTLLDLYFDNHFWQVFVPQKYAQKNQIPYEQALQELGGRYKKVAGQLDWYCVDYWSQELELDIASLKQELEHLIAVHPFVVDFLEALQLANKRIILVTNAHQKSLSLKMKKTRLNHHFDEMITAHDIGYPKESQQFWKQLQERLPFDPMKTLFVDDSLSVLKSARKYGINHLLAILKPDTTEPENNLDEFYGVNNFEKLLPEIR